MIPTGTEEHYNSCYTDWGVGIATLSSFSLLINIFHLVIISKMKSLKDRPYKLILIHITLGDICTALTLIPVYACPPILALTYRITGVRLMASIVACPLYTTHWIFVVASMEQYYRICRPFQYETSTFVKKLSLVLMSTWIINLCYVGLLVVFGWYVRTEAPHLKSAVQAAAYLSRYVPTIVAAVFFTLTIRELRKMGQTEMADGRRQVYDAAVYVIIIYSIFSASAFLDLVMASIQIAGAVQMPFSPQRLRNVAKSVYGILNTVIYGFRTQAYRQYIVSVFSRRDSE